MLFWNRFAHHSVRATFALTDCIEHIELVAGDCDHITFLGFVTPDFKRTHARFVVRHVAEFKLTAEAAIVHQFREGVRKSTCTHVMNKGNRVFFVHRPAAVDDFLAAAFHFRVFTLHRGKVEGFITGTVCDRACSTATETDEHRRTAENDQVVTRVDVTLFNVLVLDVAKTASQHNRLVVTANFGTLFRRNFLFKSTEVTENVRTAIFVVERSAAERTFDHNVQSRRNAGRASEVLFPRLNCTWKLEVRNAEARKTGLRLTTLTRCTFVADFATTTRSGTRERRNGRRVVVGFDLHQNIDFFVVEVVLVRTRIRVETSSRCTFHHSRVILISAEDVGIVKLVSVLDHLEQGLVLLHAIDGPFGTEHLVTAVFRVGLSEHVKFHVRRVALEFGEVLDEVIDFVRRKSEAHFLVGLHEGVAAFGKHRDHVQRTRFFLAEEHFERSLIRKHGLGHAVMDFCLDLFGNFFRDATVKVHIVGNRAFNALDFRKSANVSDIRCLGAPWANRTRTRSDNKKRTFRFLRFKRWTIG